MSEPAPFDARKAIRRLNIFGALLVVMLFGGVCGWAATTEIAGAVIAAGSVVVESNVKTVQHATGGIVGELRVQDGMRVNAGDVLVVLDQTVAGANLAIITAALEEALARQARLVAERDAAARIVFPRDLLRGAGQNPELYSVLAGEQSLFELRSAARLGQQSQLTERVAQLGQQIEGLSHQLAAHDEQLAVLIEEQQRNRTLFAQRMTVVSNVNESDRAVSNAQGERGRLVADIAQLRGRITETQLQILQVDQDFRSAVAAELGDLRARIGEYAERKVAAEDELRRLTIRAPQAGLVHQLAVHTIGGVIGPGDPILQIVPQSDTLTIEAHVAPAEIDQLFVGQAARLRFAAFNSRTTPEIVGAVAMISANVTVDQRSGQSFYTVRIQTTPEEVARLGNVAIIPGMQVESFIGTEPRTVASYLLKPLEDQITHAFRE